MTIASVVTRGFIGGVHYLPTRGYSQGIAPTPPAVVLLGGGPGGSKWDKKKHEYFFTPAWQQSELETRELETQAEAREQELHEARQSQEAPPEIKPARRTKKRQRLYQREDFAAYESKVLQEITDLRIRRDRLIRQRQEEEVILSILHGLPTTY